MKQDKMYLINFCNDRMKVKMMKSKEETFCVF